MTDEITLQSLKQDLVNLTAKVIKIDVQLNPPPEKPSKKEVADYLDAFYSSDLTTSSVTRLKEMLNLAISYLREED